MHILLFLEETQGILSGGDSNLRYWIGLSNVDKDGWQNTDDGSIATFFDWAAGEPTNLTASNGCVSVDLNGGWHNDDCLNSYPFICELNETTIHSTSTPPSTTTRSTTTTITGDDYDVEADVVFILDISTAVSEEQFEDTRTFILNSFGEFNVGYQEGIQVGLFSVYGDYQNLSYLVAGFDWINDFYGLGGALRDAYPSNAASSESGQSALFEAFEYVLSPEFKGSGYRDDIKNHLVVYITTTSVPDQNAIDQASAVLADGSYKLMAISYQGDGSNVNALQQLVGGNSDCVLTASTRKEYVKHLDRTFGNKIFNANM